MARRGEWRTSWLSREVLALPAFMMGVFAYGIAHAYDWPAAPWIGLLTLVASLALFVCTGMIYACLRFLQEWASPLTLVNFFLLGAASGCTLAAALAAWLAPASLSLCAEAAIVLTLLALAGRVASLARNARLRPKSSLQTAIGIRHTQIVQKAQGFMGGSFNTREFFHGASPAKLRAIKWAFLVLTFPVPILLLVAGWAGGMRIFCALAFVVSTPVCWPSAGIFSPRPITRRTSTTRRSRDTRSVRRRRGDHALGNERGDLGIGIAIALQQFARVFAQQRSRAVDARRRLRKVDGATDGPCCASLGMHELRHHAAGKRLRVRQRFAERMDRDRRARRPR